MVNIFDIVFYKFFRFNKKIGNVNNDNFYAFKSIAFLGVLICLNVFTLWFAYEIYSKVRVFKAPPIFVTLLLLATVGWMLNQIYVRNDNYKKRMERVQQFPKAIGVLGTVLTIIYSIASFAIPFILAVVFSPHNHH